MTCLAWLWLAPHSVTHLSSLCFATCAPGRKAAAAEAARAPQLRTLTRKLLLSAVASRDGGAQAQGVKWWVLFCVHGKGIPPVQHLDGDSPRWQKLEAEALLMDFVTWLVVCKPSGRRINTRTARKYVSHVINWMRRVYSADFAGGLDLTNLRDLLKGMRRELGDTPKRERYGVRTQDLQEAMDRFLPRGSSPDAQAWRAALSCALCGLLRGCEVALPEGELFNAVRHLTRADVTFRTLPDGTRVAVLMIRQAKSEVHSFTGKSVPVFLVGGGRYIDAVAELEKLFAMRPVPAEEMASTPLFADAQGRAFTRSQVSKMVKSLMQRLGHDPSRFGAHSLRIGGATAALAAGVHPSIIRITGRWSSDVWMVYARLTKQAAFRVSAVIGSTAFDDTERHAFASEELELTPDELAPLASIELPVDGEGDDSDSE